MSEQFKLFDQPPDSPSRAAKLRAFKEVHKILTHRSPHVDADSVESRWVAMLTPPKRLDGGGPIPPEWTIVDHFAHQARVLDEGGWTGYAPTEVGAIRKLCAQRGIDCTL